MQSCKGALTWGFFPILTLLTIPSDELARWPWQSVIGLCDDNFTKAVLPILSDQDSLHSVQVTEAKLTIEMLYVHFKLNKGGF